MAQCWTNWFMPLRRCNKLAFNSVSLIPVSQTWSHHCTRLSASAKFSVPVCANNRALARKNLFKPFFGIFRHEHLFKNYSIASWTRTVPSSSCLYPAANWVTKSRLLSSFRPSGDVSLQRTSNKLSTTSNNVHDSRSVGLNQIANAKHFQKWSIPGVVRQLRQDMILTVPNVLTFSRMLLTPYLGYLVVAESYTMACVVFTVAGVTDLLDGFIARNFDNQTSALGSFIDPLADKLLVSILYITLTYVHLLPLALTAMVIARDICLMTGGFYVRYISLPRPITLRHYFDLTNPSAKLQPLAVSKLNTAVQLSLVACTLAAPVFGFVDHPALHALWYLTAATTVVSGVGYVFAKDTFKLLKQRRP